MAKQWDELEANWGDELKVDAAAVLFPVPVSGGVRAVAATDLGRRRVLARRMRNAGFRVLIGGWRPVLA
jgi:hypothetical protein